MCDTRAMESFRGEDGTQLQRASRTQMAGLCMALLGACGDQSVEGTVDAAAQGADGAPAAAQDGGATQAGQDAGPDAGQVEPGDAGKSLDAASAPGLGSDAGDGNDAGGDAAVDASVGQADAALTATDAGGSNDAGVHAGGVGMLRASICTAQSYGSPLAAGGAAAASRIGTQDFSFVEGPVWVHEQRALYFSEMIFGSPETSGPPARIWRLGEDGTATVFVDSSGSNGLALGAQGTLFAAVHDAQSIARFDLTGGKRTVIPLVRGDKHLNSPNDLVLRSDGMVFLTDPDWQLGTRTSGTGITGVYRVGPSLEDRGPYQVVSLDDTLDKPNGIALSPDEHTLYVGSQGTEVIAYDLATDGSVSNRRTFAQAGPSDGMTVDCAGNLYVTEGAEKRVRIFGPTGTLLGQVDVPESPTNVAFGGPDLRTLYITAQAHLYRAELGVPGLPY
jgi:gluconolactonase